MTNREKLIKTNIYDLLIRIARNGGCCVLDTIEKNKGHACTSDDCGECIENWLNKEAD